MNPVRREEIMQVTGVILAGGKSTRMRSDKVLAKLRGVTLLENALARMGKVFQDLILVTNQPQAYRAYIPEQVRIVSDIIPGGGPLSGIHAGLTRAGNPHIFAVACDMAFLNVDLIRYMLGLIPGYDCVVPRIGPYCQPLFALYSKRCLPVIEAALAAGDTKISEIYDQVATRYVDETRISQYDAPEIIFFNINHPADLRAAEEIAGERPI
jgi:molybdopterin-guanine dinucleotide biosynthesis protein A